MAKKRNLGMGLDLLLTAGEARQASGWEAGNIGLARETMEEALKQDEQGKFLEAYYLYRRLIDLLPESSWDDQEKGFAILSQALNNAAIILFEHGEVEKSRLYLEKSLSVQPDNQVASSNMKQLKTSIISNKGG